MLIRQLFDPETWTYTYLLADTGSPEAIIIDPVLNQVERDMRLVSEMGVELTYTLDTHVHADHISGSGELRRRTGALSGMAAANGVDCVDRQLNHGDMLLFGKQMLEVRSTPGHTAGCLTFVLQTDGQTMAFTGDTLLIRGSGRTDFQGGDSAALFRSVHEQIFTLPDSTLIYPGHDYRGHTVSTVLEEKQYNPRLKIENSEEMFIEIMDALTLAEPKFIHEALPANLACGQLPIEENSQDPQLFKDIHISRVTTLDEGRIVDVRHPEELRGEYGVMPKAESVPLFDLEKVARDWERHLPLYVVCRTGRRSYQACHRLVEMGFTNVTNLAGGMAAWSQGRDVSS